MSPRYRLLLIGLCCLAIPALGLVRAPRPAAAAGRPTYLIAFLPLNWHRSLAEFDAEAQRQGELFMRESGMTRYADVELRFIHAPLSAALDDPWLVETVVAFGLSREPADRYVGVTDGDLILDGDHNVVGWTQGPDALGVVMEAGFVNVAAHELGHTYALCDEYLFATWSWENAAWGCPNPFPPDCPRGDWCGGLPAPDGRSSIMAGAGVAGGYAYNAPCLEHLQLVFAALFGSAPAPTPAAPTPTVPAPTPAAATPSPEPTAMPTAAPPAAPPRLALADPDLVRLDPDGSRTVLAPGPVFQPAWSPDGAWIAFSAAPSGDLDLYRVPAAGGAAQRLTRLAGRELYPAWTADSAGIIFAWDGAGSPALHLLDLSTGETRPLAGLPAPAGWPALAPDGRTLAFAAAPQGDWDLYQVALDDHCQPRPDTLARLTRTPGEDIAPAWRTDGAGLAFASARTGALALYWLAPAGAAGGPLVEPLVQLDGSAWAPRWTPDGRLVFQAYTGAGLAVWLLDPAAGSAAPLEAAGAPSAWPAPAP